MAQFKKFDENKQTHELTIKIRFKTDPTPGAYYDPEDFEKMFRRKVAEVEADWYHLQISDSSIKKLDLASSRPKRELLIEDIENIMESQFGQVEYLNEAISMLHDAVINRYPHVNS